MSTISKFNPHDMNEDAVLRLATGRAKEQQQIDDAIASNQGPEGVRTHLLVRAPRGFGKSFLMRLTQIRLHQRWAAGEKIAVALLPEEQMNITAPDLLLREILRVFRSDAPTTVTARWDRSGEWDAAAADLTAALDAQFGAGQGLLVAIVENLDLLLAKAFPETVDQSRLRKWLNAGTSRVMLIAGTASGDLDNHPALPLFKQFTPIELHGWSEADCVAYLRLLVAEKGGELNGEREAKARAIATFIGGNPRLSVILGDVLLSDDALNTAGLLDRLVDELTPYYQDRIGSLGGRAQSLLDALLRGGEPCSQSVLAERVGAKQSDIARAFKELQVARIVVGERAQGGKESLYRVEDRVFAHYYRKRHLWHGQDYSPFAAITEFLKLYFNNDEKRAQALSLAERGHLEEAKLLFGLAQQERPQVGRYWRCRFAMQMGERCLDAITQIDPTLAGDLRSAVEAMGDEDVVTARSGLARMSVPGPVEPWYNVLFALTELVAGRDEAAAQQAQKACNSDTQIVAKLITLYSLVELSQHVDAVAMAREVASLAASVGDVSGQAVAMQYAAWSLGQLRRHEEAVAMVREATLLAATVHDVSVQALAARSGTWSLGELGRYEEAVAMAHEAASLADCVNDVRGQAIAKRCAAWSLGQLGRHEEAIALAREAALLAAYAGNVNEQAIAASCEAWCLNHLGKYEESLISANNAISLAESIQDWFEWSRSLAIAIDSASHLHRDEWVLTLADEWLTLFSCKGESAGLVPPGYWVRHLGPVLVRRNQWPQDLPVLSRAFEHLDDVHQRTCGLYAASAVIDLSSSAGRAEAYAAVAGCLHAVAPSLGEPDAEFGSFVQVLLDGIATQATDPGLLSDIAALVRQVLPARFATQAAMLDAASLFHAAGRDPVSLQRVDPDIAIAIRRVWAVPDEQPPPPKKPRRKAKPA